MRTDGTKVVVLDWEKNFSVVWTRAFSQFAEHLNSMQKYCLITAVRSCVGFPMQYSMNTLMGS